MTKTVVFEYALGTFAGTFPQVPTAAGVDMDALRQTDTDPMFVTLPIVPEVGATSRNGLLYDEALADSIVKQINDKRPEGIFGHLRDEERSSSYPEPAAIWVGAMRDGSTVWAKALVTDPRAKDRIRRLKATGGQIATSIYGKGRYEQTSKAGVRRLADFDLETLDFAPPARAALQNGAQPAITAELEQGDPEMTKEELIAELTAGDIPQELREQIIGEAQSRSQTATTIAELQQQIADRDAMVTELQGSIAEQQRTQFETDLDSRVAELTDWQVTGEDAESRLGAFRRTLRARIVAELGDQRDSETVAETVQTVWDDMEPLAETLRDKLAGPAAAVGGRGRQRGENYRELDLTPENVRKARGEWGF